ncbi:MAG TPA: helix-turn-helix domain-containing protein [Trichormus sp.]
MTGIKLTENTLAEILLPGYTKPAGKPALTMEQLIETVAAHYRIEASEIRSAKRSQDLTLPRHVAMYLAHELMQMSYPRIGQAFGNRKHTSALYADTRIKEQLPRDPELAMAIKQIRRQLGC